MEDLNARLIVPLAGIDKQFESLGEHKILTQVFGKTVIEWIIKSRPYDLSKALFLLLREHDLRFSIRSRLEAIFNQKLDVLWVESLTAGAPQTVLLAEECINEDEPLCIDLLDQYIDFGTFNSFANNTLARGIIPTFESLYFNRGYMHLNPHEKKVLKVSEKDSTPISTHSTACVSYFKKGGDFIWGAKKMIANKHVSANGCYMISMVFNELIEENYWVTYHPCEFIASLGTLKSCSAFEETVRPVVYS